MIYFGYQWVWLWVQISNLFLSASQGSELYFLGKNISYSYSAVIEFNMYTSVIHAPYNGVKQ